ncbi:MAG: class I mannose-6-phosphate isomerase [Gemmatales bacterium]|nr:class I mannose-6-phosphate isomerase [Gemmatales bacterium]MDW8387441.1 class I mannose-6-phosphate isomerase [Gemmatales bacterium]
MSHAPCYPLEFEPFFRPMPWGGHRLAGWVDSATLPSDPVGEAWLLSDHPLHVSRVAKGPLQGTTLHAMLSDFGSHLPGSSPRRFPLLIKLLDARENLSVQVHPDDDAARTWAPDEGGKTEAWLVLEADPDSAIYLGLKEGVSREDVARAMHDGTLTACLDACRPRPGECYFVPAGAVHALGGGLVVLEVQQTSDATFRMYDWGRRDAQGRPRPLHEEAALAVLRERFDNIGKQEPIRLAWPSAFDVRLRVRCPFFQMIEFLADQSGASAGLASPAILILLDGRIEIGWPDGSLTPRRGRAVLLPHGLEPVTVHAREACRFVLVLLGP